MSAKADTINRETAYRVAKILESICADRTKYEQLDALMLSVMQTHPDGLAAPVLRTIDAAMTKVMYPQKGK
jgi:hypothetical protein